MDKNKLLVTPEQEKIIHLENDLLAIRSRLHEQKVSTKYWQRQHELAEERLAVVTSLSKNKPIKIKALSKSSLRSETTPLLVLSDWHVEERVEPSVVNNLNEYTPDIADSRITKLFNRTLKLISIWRKDTAVNELVVGILGDMINGYIHEDFTESNFMSPTEAVLWVEKRIIGGLDFLLNNGKFKRIYVLCTFGNHGRTTKQARIKLGYKNSYEWLMYQHIKEYYLNEDRVVIQVENGYHGYINIYDMTIRMHHGDGIRYNGGVGGLFIPANKAVASWNRTLPAFLDVFGHYHQHFDGDIWISNGSLIGYNLYAMKQMKALYRDPSQTLIFLEKNLGKTGVHQIYVK